MMRARIVRNGCETPRLDRGSGTFLIHFMKSLSDSGAMCELSLVCKLLEYILTSVKKGFADETFASDIVNTFLKRTFYGKKSKIRQFCETCLRTG